MLTICGPPHQGLGLRAALPYVPYHTLPYPTLPYPNLTLPYPVPKKKKKKKYPNRTDTERISNPKTSKPQNYCHAGGGIWLNTCPMTLKIVPHPHNASHIHVYE